MLTDSIKANSGRPDNAQQFLIYTVPTSCTCDGEPVSGKTFTTAAATTNNSVHLSTSHLLQNVGIPFKNVRPRLCMSKQITGVKIGRFFKSQTRLELGYLQRHSQLSPLQPTRAQEIQRGGGDRKRNH